MHDPVKIPCGKRLMLRRERGGADILGITELASHCSPKLVAQSLNIIYSIFDDITERNDVFKVTFRSACDWLREILVG